jgi:hypothetical protein
MELKNATSVDSLHNRSVAAVACACHSIWMKRVINSLGFSFCKCVKIFCDNSSTIKLSKNPILHGRTKHIDVKFYFLCDLVKEGAVELIHCGTREQVADILTKPLKLESFTRLRDLLGVQSIKTINRLVSKCSLGEDILETSCFR